MRSVVAFPGNMLHAQHIARALFEADALDAYVTAIAWRDEGWLSNLLKRLPLDASNRLASQLARRSIREIPPDLVRGVSWWEFARTAASLCFESNPIPADILWDRMSRSFDQRVAQTWVPRTQAIHGFEYTALASFEQASRSGQARVLHLPSLDSREFEAIQRHEREAWPELRTKYDAYFDGKFMVRYERRQREIQQADVIIVNSSATARSHIAAGADAAKVYAVPLAAPVALSEIRADEGNFKKPLRLLWAGNFSLRKGAHYMLNAWKQASPGRAAELHVYGRCLLPEKLTHAGTEGIIFHGSVSQAELFKLYERFDALVFPTLSDGFGMVVTEAMAHGLPVITTRRAGSADLVTSENGLLVPPADVKALEESIRWCLDNREKLSAMRPAALATARGRQWSHYRSDLIKAIDEGLARAGFQPDFRSPK